MWSAVRTLFLVRAKWDHLFEGINCIVNNRVIGVSPWIVSTVSGSNDNNLYEDKKNEPTQVWLRKRED